MKFRIIYLEHEDERHHYKVAMEAAGGVVVDMLATPDDQMFFELLNANRYDLLITDANFLEEGKDHSDYGPGEYKLDYILNSCRNKDNRMKVAVLTSFSPELLSTYDIDLSNVDYLWDKQATPDSFITWQIKSIMRDINREYPQNQLLNQLTDLILDAKWSHPWKDDISKMIASYRSRDTEKDKVDSIKTGIGNIFSQYNVRKEYNDLFDALVDMEPLNIAGKPSAWGHLRHSINVFWLGFYIINCGLVDKKSLQTHLKLEKESDIDFIWLMAALFHDIGYLCEISDNIITNCNKLANMYPSGILKFNSVSKKYVPELLEDVIPRLQTLCPASISPFYTKLISELYAYDHGVVSALTVYRHLNNKITAYSLLQHACAAILTHNVMPPKTVNEYNKSLKFDDMFFAALLILCDNVQAWERETGRESLKSKIPLETVELSLLAADLTNRKLFLKINYLPFKYIHPLENIITVMKDELTQNITSYVKPALDTLKDPNRLFSIDIEFWLDGRTRLETWTNI